MGSIGVFAGSFDPIHDGHIEVARQCIDLLDLDALYFMVEDKPWGMKSPTDLEHRSEMVDLAITTDEKIHRYSSSQDRFSIDETLPEIEKKFAGNDLYFILGADVFMNMNENQWPNLSRLLEHYIVVFERSNINADEIQDKAKTLGIATAIFPSPHPHHSSTDVRMSPHTKDIWVQAEVADYIDDNGLYKLADSSEVK